MLIVEEKDAFYGVPVTRLDHLDEYAPSAGDPEQIFLLDIGDGMELGFMVRASNSLHENLRIGLHSAKVESTPDGHWFAPVELSRNAPAPFVLFSDPTLSLAPRNRLSWYLGTPNVDPDDWMEKIIRKVMAATGSHYPVFEGSSAGGFVAMRLAARFGNGIAVPRIPQTDLFRYGIHWPLQETLQAAWPGMSHAAIMAGYAHRFRIMDLYTDQRWNRGNHIMYIHNVGDYTHTRDHLVPMLAEFGADEHAYKALDGRLTVSRPYVGEGHIGIPSSYWRADAELALVRIKQERPANTNAEGSYQRPANFVPGEQANLTRVASIELHVKHF